MKVRIVLNIIGRVLKIMSLLLIVPGIVSTYYHETGGVIAFALTALLSLFAGIILMSISINQSIAIFIYYKSHSKP